MLTLKLMTCMQFDTHRSCPGPPIEYVNFIIYLTIFQRELVMLKRKLLFPHIFSFQNFSLHTPLSPKYTSLSLSGFSFHIPSLSVGVIYLPPCLPLPLPLLVAALTVGPAPSPCPSLSLVVLLEGTVVAGLKGWDGVGEWRKKLGRVRLLIYVHLGNFI